MYNISNNVRYWLLLACLLVTSCDDNYLERYPLDGPSSASFYSNEQELMMGLYGCYKAINFNAKSNRPWPIIMDVTSDIAWNRSNHQIQYIGNGSHDSDNGTVKAVWREFYQAIGRCNFLLDNIHKVEGKIDPELYTTVKAEARFVRALSYHYLIEFFGGVPLITKTLKLEEAEVPRNTKAEVADFVISELDAAAKDLPKIQEGDEFSGRATKGAALAYKARTALYNERWDVAAEAAKAVMDLKVYQLHPDFQELFTYEGETSDEIIFALQYKKGVDTHSTTNYFTSRLAGGVSNEIPSQSLVDSYEAIDGLSIDKSDEYDPARPFENRDPRLGYTIVLPGSILFGYQFETHDDSVKIWNYNTTPPTRIDNVDADHAYASFSGYLFRKYTDIEDMEDDSHSAINLILMRYAEVLLIYAEAKIEAGEIDASVYNAINQVRNRPSVEMPPIEAGKSQSELRSAVRKERKYELAMEGLRLFDIRRWGIAEDVMDRPFLGRIPNKLLSNAPVVDANGTPDYSNVANASEMRIVEMRSFNPERDYLWPIPYIEILTNNKLKQNPHY